jgi:hypothetical protein
LVWPGRICRFFYELLARRYLLDVLLRDIRQGSGGDVPDAAAEVRDAVGSVIADPEIAEAVEHGEVAVPPTKAKVRVFRCCGPDLR